jgi:Mycothiol maleylpyruvate isomerase N-terminal domain
MIEEERRQLQSDLAVEREALLAAVSDVDESALTRPTRNPEWTVRDVLAHVLASDADLIALVEAAGSPTTVTIRMPGPKQHQREMARWSTAIPRSFSQELRARGDRWVELLGDLRSPSWALPVLGNWWPQDALSGSASETPANGGTRPLGDVVADWRGHDAQHGEDVRLAVADGTNGPD